MTQQDDFEAAVEEIDAALMLDFPDPVDVSEDDLAAKLKLARHPALSLEEWRVTRVSRSSLPPRIPIRQEPKSRRQREPLSPLRGGGRPGSRLHFAALQGFMPKKIAGRTGATATDRHWTLRRKSYEEHPRPQF